MKRTQRGISLIETLGAIAVGGIMLTGLTTMIFASMDDSAGQQAAQYQAQVTEAARKYITANYDTLVTQTAGGSIATVDLDALRTGHFLSSGFGSANVFGQSPCVLVHQASAGKLDALVATYGGRKIPLKDIAFVAASAGPGGGYIAETDATTARGVSWTLDTAPFQGAACGVVPALTGTATDGGHLVSSLFYDGQTFADYLYRDQIDGREDLNTMNAPLRMALKAVVSAGAACGTSAALATDAAHEILKCGADGKWNYLTTWKNPVATYNDLLGLSDNVGDVRLTLDTKRAFAYAGGNTWKALAVDQNGDLNVQRDVLAGRDIDSTNGSFVAWNGNISGHDITSWGNAYATNVYASNNITATRNIYGNYAYLTNDVNARNVNASNDVNAGDDVNATYDVYAGDFLDSGDGIRAQGRRSAGQACHIFTRYDPVTGAPLYIDPIGTMVRDTSGSGLLLICARDKTFRYQNGTYSP